MKQLNNATGARIAYGVNSALNVMCANSSPPLAWAIRETKTPWGLAILWEVMSFLPPIKTWMAMASVRYKSHKKQ